MWCDPYLHKRSLKGVRLQQNPDNKNNHPVCLVLCLIMENEIKNFKKGLKRCKSENGIPCYCRKKCSQAKLNYLSVYHISTSNHFECDHNLGHLKLKNTCAGTLSILRIIWKDRRVLIARVFDRTVCVCVCDEVRKR